jgi:Zn-dependent protease
MVFKKTAYSMFKEIHTMFDRQVPLFKLKGFKVGMDWSWLILALLVTWSLAAGLFPHYLEGLSTTTYWWMGAAGALGLFFSIVFHEFCHSLVARRYGMPIRGIT